METLTIDGFRYSGVEDIERLKDLKVEMVPKVEYKVINLKALDRAIMWWLLGLKNNQLQHTKISLIHSNSNQIIKFIQTYSHLNCQSFSIHSKLSPLIYDSDEAYDWKSFWLQLPFNTEEFHGEIPMYCTTVDLITRRDVETLINYFRPIVDTLKNQLYLPKLKVIDLDWKSMSGVVHYRIQSLDEEGINRGSVEALLNNLSFHCHHRKIELKGNFFMSFNQDVEMVRD